MTGGDWMEELEPLGRDHVPSDEERADWRHKPPPALTDAELDHLWRRYQQASDEGRLAAKPPSDDITSREFHRLLIEVERLRQEARRQE